MKVVLCVTRPREWKLLLVAPDVVAHDEETNRSAARILVLDSFERVIKPLHRDSGLVYDSVFTEHHVANLSGSGRWCMRPWANHQTLTGASFGSRRLLV